MTTKKVTPGTAARMLTKRKHPVSRRTVRRWCVDSDSWRFVNPEKMRLKTARKTLTGRWWVDKKEIDDL